MLAGPITVGDTIYIGANGLGSVAGTVVLGKTLTTATEAGAVVEFIPKLNNL
jgi:hypothetical protein